MLDYSEQIVLLQPVHTVQLCNLFVSSSDSALEVRRLKKFVAAIARLSLRQRMLLVFCGYQARFARTGVSTPGNSHLGNSHYQNHDHVANCVQCV